MAIDLRCAGLVLLLLGAAPPQDSARQAALMDRIERALVLPKGAEPFARYGRNYAPAGPDRVRAVYVVPPRASARNGCTVLLAGDASRPCTSKEIAQMVKNENAAIAAQARAGQRRWHARASSLPGAADGGCGVVTIEYSISRNRVLSATCNGEE